ncbi:hypothetical protein EQG41_01860 [Billgrantia azerbaijanica]|nr:hypothetical protein EQG41_01860 [Halomonas azerbaijanica]
MSNNNRTKLWVGVGTSVLLGTSATGWAEVDSSADHTQAPDGLLLASAEHGGEGGEGAEGGEAGHHHEGGEGGEGGEAGHHHEGGKRWRGR